MQVAGLVFNGLTTLDIVGPIEVLARIPGIEIVVVAASRGAVRDAKDCWSLGVDATLQEVLHPDVLVVPGGPGVAAACEDAEIRNWIREVDRTTTWTTSVCCGLDHPRCSWPFGWEARNDTLGLQGGA